MNVLPPAVSARLAVVIPLSVRVGSPVTASEVLVSVVLAATVSTRMSPGGPVSVPFPLQPLMLNVLPPELVSERSAVVIPLRPSDMLPEFSVELVKLKPAFALAVTIPVAVSESDPLPVQPLTVNVLLALVAARLAVVMPKRPSVMPSVEDREVLLSV